MISYIEDIRQRALRVLTIIFEGNMIEVYAAYANIFPGSWQRDLTDDEQAYIPNILETSHTYK